ncbi:MAG: membrane protein insertion efficiency factor YidD [Omnitrophica WOR_2 bacterium RIFCSPLOWO2_12_FULL_46_30]|nr:MAG: membrane protein insertion efficiency factor YidD [Omnitrophica WOR_2 bacterium RIFCSPHIGHO2_02_FULL_46_37]OGX43956.1 MAG: membrane protein insertion efficiency factor YidD [Omnitrophica WOR_2 bacterium RIFCSPLOWO2_02_FULL_45_28]OGX51721.1 MAG: membrane protein insertion efficiency factor YidD [Omnitrophica WOR_2 bacterium RIFCSPLOWO2_12_FULL_46_30]
MLFFLSKAGARLIRFYQKHISMRLTPSCRYYPSCSRYFLEAVGMYGIIRGCGKGFLRIIRCNPFSPGGDDPVVK